MIREIQASGKKIVCYFSGGSYEEWREDAGLFNEEVLGETLDGWPDERWLDIRSGNVREIMSARLNLAQQKGCDGVEPDNMDGYINDSGFDLSYADQLAFNQFVAVEAHDRGLAVGLKNDLDQIPELVNYFDFAVNEQCHEYDECGALMAFIEADKPVFNAEYQNKYVNNKNQRQKLCEDARDRNFQTLVLPLDLDDSFRFDCN